MNATNGGGTSAYSASWSFTTVATPAGLVAAYAFNEGTGTTVADASGNTLTGTISGATWTTGGKYGSALVFNGTNALVTIPNAASLQLTVGMTLEVWVNPTTVSGAWRDVIYKGDDNYYLEGMSPQSQRPGMGGTFSPSPLYGTAALTANTWTHLAATYDGATMRLYVNGVQVASRAQTGNIATSTNPLQIGGDSIYGQYFAGMIDEVRIYSRALTQTEIQTDMNAPLTPPAASIQISSPGSETGLTTTTRPMNEIPSEYVLEQNYPNPFNPSTVFEFALPKQSHVTLELYNLLGERVSAIIDGTLAAGYYSVPFNGSSLASGVYFYRMQTDDFVQTKKLLLLK